MPSGNHDPFFTEEAEKAEKLGTDCIIRCFAGDSVFFADIQITEPKYYLGYRFLYVRSYGIG
jgi:hypothetical protein